MKKGAKMPKNEEEWKKNLTSEQYRVLREKSTELPFTGKLLHNKGKGRYVCAGCGAELFDSDTKFDSGTGWPSFYDAKKGAVKFVDDKGLFMKRTEVICAKCGGHLGHVFDDAHDMPTGKRFCINSCALGFEGRAESKEKKK